MNKYEKLAKQSRASQDVWEMSQMLELVARHVRPKVVVEIGVFLGGGLETFQKAFSPKKSFGIETEKHEEQKGLDIIYGESLHDGTIKAVKDKLGRSKIDFLFIDGDHHYEIVKAEYQAYLPFMSKKSAIGFHDTNSRGIEGVEVNRLMHELDLKQTYRTVDLRAGLASPGTRILFL